ncbi:MAG: carbamoyltransferase C-terminal domain-containing protein, partial [Gammaproteobacteria bacterium]
GIAPFGDPNKYDLSPLAKIRNKKFYVDTRLIGTVGLRRYKAKSRGHYFSQKLVDMLGPRRVGNLVDDPYVHYAAAIQKLYEDMAVRLIELHLGEVLADCGRLAVAGTGSLNIRLNQRLAAMPQVKELVVHSAAGDSGTAIGAAAYAVRKAGEKLKPVPNLLLGPSYSRPSCIAACRRHRENPDFVELENPHEKAAELLAQGEPVAWFRGRMEFGSRALGNRSILANPTIEGISDAINTRVKFRESWRPFSPSVLDIAAAEFLGNQPRDEFMCVGVIASDSWREKYPALVYPDGGTRAQIVTEQGHPDFYRLLQRFHELTGHPLLINTSLSRPGEALVCSPDDALNMFMGTDLKYLVLQDLLVTKRALKETW